MIKEHDHSRSLYSLIIVDDEERIRRGLVDQINWGALGFRVVGEAANGLEALRLLKERHVDVVLSDIRMPVMSGVDLARELESSRYLVIIVFLSGYRDFEYARAGLRHGVRDYITKPTKQNDIVRTFSEIHSELVMRHARIDTERGTAPDASEWSYIDYKREEEIVARARQLAVTDLKEANLGSIAERLGVDYYQLSRLFARVTGSTFQNYVTKLRMERAAELLTRLDYRVFEVSALLGYSDQRSFIRAFKKYTGLPPSSYRKQHAGDSP